MTKTIVIRDGQPYTNDDKGSHRSTIAELVAEIERLRPAAESWESYVAAQERKERVAAEPTAEPANMFRIVRGKLPPGVSFNIQTGEISGTPDEVGVWNVEIDVDEVTGDSSRYHQTIIRKYEVVPTVETRPSEPSDEPPPCDCDTKDKYAHFPDCACEVWVRANLARRAKNWEGNQ